MSRQPVTRPLESLTCVPGNSNMRMRHWSTGIHTKTSGAMDSATDVARAAVVAVHMARLPFSRRASSSRLSSNRVSIRCFDDNSAYARTAVRRDCFDVELAINSLNSLPFEQGKGTCLIRFFRISSGAFDGS